MVAPTFYTISLIEKESPARQIVVLRFSKPEVFTFAAGQFVQVRVPEGEKFVLRSYSISSTPNDPYLELCVKILPEGKASALFDGLKIGESVEISAPRGVFVVKPDHHNRKVFVATGTGIAPVVSMLLENAPNAGARELLFGVRSQADLFWQERFAALASRDSNFHYAITLSRPEGEWNGLTGRVIDHVSVDTAADYYICGNVDMVKDVRAKLLAGGVNTKSIHLEIF